ncbi:2,3-bisphosphoglycerate-dependent phosphoglycerate mutase [Ligilactobacillus salitolerans]|uniref:2,3-bisphosphoglycerate-dependent phosphoglycerate mutase n=1 Tax=Ligilactobacillus salitolerans TaxID=1808352 RepID=A0A401IUU0_9LACO|nr:2,3-bisphosphoglycerate-dependent phosphoglycerate mutase [Ligilactobacillus salitolerans]GBG95275.1 2,3-bisphosphoglycerate-dependent phosphoglycerate mutase [Ligilactobacillus salitolerans]
MAYLVLLRHGQSLANKVNEYTGWSDSPLTEKGVKQAHAAGHALFLQHLEFTDVHTSVLVRAIKTADIVQEELHQAYLPLHKSWRLNERHYGALRGWNKDDTRQIFGPKQVALWRRSYYAVPPKLKFPVSDRRYAKLPLSSLPLAESLAMASERIIPYWVDQIAPRLLQGHNQLVVAHGSTLRAMIKFIEQISDENIDGVEVANGEPIIYDFDQQLNVLHKKIIQY